MTTCDAGGMNPSCLHVNERSALAVVSERRASIEVLLFHALRTLLNGASRPFTFATFYCFVAKPTRAFAFEFKNLLY